MTELKRVMVQVSKKPLDELDAYITGRIAVLKEKAKEEDMKVTFDPEPISYEDLDTRLRKARQKAAGVHALLTAVHMDLESWHEGEPLTIVMRELEVLEHLLDDTVLRYAESVADQIKRQLA